jgi:hypothetical protein
MTEKIEETLLEKMLRETEWQVDYHSKKLADAQIVVAALKDMKMKEDEKKCNSI